MALSPQWLDELRGRVTLSTLVGRTVPMKRAGNEWRGCCPFHEEKTPSFYVNDAKAFYHCFGCGAHGDAIGWMIDQRGLAFIDAVKELASEAGLEMPAPDPQAKERHDERAGLHDVTAAAARWFAARLQAAEGAAARAYLTGRGVTDERVAAFDMGFAPDRRDALTAALPFTAEQLTQVGLLVEAEGRANYDRFRDRLIIPIHDARGRVIGFGGRTLSDATPKYLNSPETPLFDKGRTLFNLHRAAPAARKAGRLLVVEGYLDVIALAGAGVDEVVAPLGTAVTEAQLELLWRHVDVPILCFDGDAAGERAAGRVAERALPLLGGGRSLAFVTLPDGQDPDDVVRNDGAATLERLLAGAEPMVDRLYRAARGTLPLHSPEAKAAVRAKLDSLAALVNDRDLARDYNRALRDRLYEEGRAAWSARGGVRSSTARARPVEARPSATALAVSGTADQALLRAVLAGLCQRSGSLGELAEPLARLPTPAGALTVLRDRLVASAWSDSELDLSSLEPICAEAGVELTGKRSLHATGLAFSWLRKGVDDELGLRDLIRAIQIVTDLARDEHGLAEVTGRLLKAEGDEFDALHREQNEFRRRVCRARDDLNDFATGDDLAAAATG